ncbi:MAG: hypothetical protein WEB04_08505 [Dehalococcoidia bacterium]
MKPHKAAIRASVQRNLASMLGEERARLVYDAVSASRELAWNSFRRRLYPSFWRRSSDERGRGVRSVAIHGEFGDAILALPFLYRERQRRPGERIAVLIKGANSRTAQRTKGDPFAEGGLRRMRDGAGSSINFLADFWRRVPFVDEVHEGDVSDPRFHYWQPQPAFTLQRQTVGPSDYAPFLDQLFAAGDVERAREIWSRTARPLRIVVHLRRSADEIVALLERLDASSLASSCAVAVLGSRHHERIPNLARSRIDLIDLTDNYEKGISIMPLLQSIRMADLFIGGRGGFELFALAAGVPAITVFDEDGWWEQRRLWPERLWDENPLRGFVRASQFDAQRELSDPVLPWLTKVLASRSNAAARSAAS